MNTDTPDTNTLNNKLVDISPDEKSDYWLMKLHARKLERKLTAATAQRDRLAAVLQRIRDGYGGQVASPNCCEDCDYLLPIDEALQSLTPKP